MLENREDSYDPFTLYDCECVLLGFIFHTFTYCLSFVSCLFTFCALLNVLILQACMEVL